MQWWCDSEIDEHWQRGYCEPGPHHHERDANCATAARGYWADVATGAACEERCRQCARCKYVSYSPEDKECAWVQACDLQRLAGAVGVITGHCSAQVQRTMVPASAPALGPDTRLALRGGARGARGDASLGIPQAQGISSMKVVIASCADDLHWALPLAATLDVIVLEKCAGAFDDLKRPVQRKPCTTASDCLLPHEIIAPNLGREAHSYLWYIVNHWDTLHDATVFLQGDMSRHVGEGEILGPSASAADLAGNLSAPTGLLGRFYSDNLSFLALSTVLSANTMAMGRGFGLKEQCELFRSFTPGATPGSQCPTWTAFALANFVVSRRAVHRLPRATYAAWLAQLEAAGPKVAARLAVLYERAWSAIFACSQPLRTSSGSSSACNFDENTTVAQLDKRCPIAGRWLPSRQLMPALVQGEVGPFACRELHPIPSPAIAQTFRVS